MAGWAPPWQQGPGMSLEDLASGKDTTPTPDHKPEQTSPALTPPALSAQRRRWDQRLKPRGGVFHSLPV